MSSERGTVYVIDDDEAMRDSLQWLLESGGLQVATFPSAEKFLAACRPGLAGCLILDVRMPGMSGLELHDKLAELQCTLPVIFVTGHGDVPMAVSAIKKGAVEFIEKPFNDDELLELVEKSLQLDARRRRQAGELDSIRTRLAELTPREREGMDKVIAGKLNKIIADELGISIKTVEVHRARIMEKMDTSPVAELVRLVMAAAPARLEH